MKNIFYFLLVLTLTGCTQFNKTENPIESSALSWHEYQQHIQALRSWSLSGKIAIFIDDERQSANIYWQQQEDNYAIQLTSFIGTRILQVTKNKKGIEIINHEGEVFTGSDANQLVQKLSPGLDLPISALQEWIKGNPTNASYQLNDQQYLSDLLGKDANDGLWHVKYPQYKHYDGYTLPSSIDLKRQKMRLKIAIHHWELAPK